MAAVTVSFTYLALFALVAFTFATVRSCLYDSDCDIFKICCHGECKTSCSTPSSGCTSSFDCPDLEFCCDGKCKDGGCNAPNDYNDPGNTILIIMGALFGFMAIVIVISVCFCRRRTVTIERTVITTEEPLFHDPVPQSYQQSYSYPHPAQFGQPQMHVPPPYNPTTAAVRAQHPPYTTETTGRSGGVYAPKTSYGALQPAGRV